jgi:lipopolysaccharide/colanic/teichoic acid biosynthesis glycosyltransferase
MDTPRQPAPLSGTYAVPPYGGFLRTFEYAAFKNVCDCVVGQVLLLAVAPVVVLAAIAVRLTSRGPAFFFQRRLGFNGRVFKIVKLRTMTTDCERASGPRWSGPSDPRVTPVGRFLRRTHIDELPQLWNVIRGEMSLVGPRPERPEFLPRLSEAIPRYRDRLRVRPGMTGLAQIQLPPDRDLADVRRKLACDLYYVRQLNPWLDLRILMGTASYLLGLPFVWTRVLFRVPDLAEVEASNGMEPSVDLDAPRLQTV